MEASRATPALTGLVSSDGLNGCTASRMCFAEHPCWLAEVIGCTRLQASASSSARASTFRRRSNFHGIGRSQTNSLIHRPFFSSASAGHSEENVMRTLAAIVGLLGLFGFEASAQTTDKPKAAEVCVLNVSGMFCGACAKTVEKTAKKIDGVKSAKVSQPKGTAEITYDPAKTSPYAIAKATTEKTPFKSELPPRR